MGILTIPLRNLRRKPLRALLLVALFTAGVASITALDYVSRGVGLALEEKLTAFGANILISPRQETLSIGYGGFSLGDVALESRTLDETEVRRGVADIEMAQRISAVAPKLVAVARPGGADVPPVGVVGVSWPDELALKSWWAVDGEVPQAQGEVLAGHAAARALGLAPGDAVELFGRRVRVSGVLEPTGGDDDGVLLAPLADVQRWTDRPGAVSFVEVAALCAGCPIEDIAAQLAAALPGTDVKALQGVVKQRMYTVGFVQTLSMAVSLVLLVTACATVGLSMLSAVNERRKEIGILRSLGYRKGQVFAIFCVEALAIGVAAGVMGYVGGYFAGGEILASLDMADGLPSFSLGGYVVAVVLVTLSSALAAAWPARKAAKVDPSLALMAY